MKLLHSVTSGSVSNPVVVILHGLFGCSDNWGSFARSWSDRFRIVRIDLPGHGSSPWINRIAYPGTAEMVLATVAEVVGESTPCAIVGHSVGGRVAMAASAASPARVVGVVFVDVGPDPLERRHDDIIEALGRLGTSRVSSRAEADDLLGEWISDRRVRSFLLKNLRRGSGSEGYRLSLDIQAIRDSYEDLLAPPLGAEVVATGRVYLGPALLVRGGESSYVSDRDVAILSRLFPQLTSVTIEGAGHWVHADRPQEFDVAVLPFLESAFGRGNDET